MKPHGVRARYVTGCRCEDCRRANRDYERLRAASNKVNLVSPGRARRRLRMLSKRGVGYRAVADATDLSRGAVLRIAAMKRGSQMKIRALTEKKILSVTADAHADGAMISAERTAKRIKKLLAEGFTKTRLSKEIGSGARPLQIARKPEKKITAKSAMKIEKLFNKYMAA